ncbi:MAG: inorganic phosphate transporter [Gaiellaceae bacterium]
MDDAILVAVVGVALFFDFTNGFHDTANSIATSVSTRALTPRTAVILAAILNFAGAFYSLEVAATIATGIVDTEAVTLSVILAGLVGAISWNLVTWFLALPSSSSHALIGGVGGAAIAAAGWDVIKWNGIWEKVVTPGVLSPTLWFVIALAMMFGIMWVIRKRSPSRVNRVFRRAQIASGSFVAFTHGTNDAQKTMGIIALALIVSGHLDAEEFDVPLWVVASAALAMGLGTYAGGWRIIKTMGTRIAKLDPPQGFAAQTACAGILWTTAHLGVPVSTTQTISGCVMGSGASRRLSAVRWGIAGNIAVAWILTLPAAGLVGAVMEVVTRMPAGNLIVFLLAGAIAAAAFLGRRYETRRLLPAHA